MFFKILHHSRKPYSKQTKVAPSKHIHLESQHWAHGFAQDPQVNSVVRDNSDKYRPNFTAWECGPWHVSS